MRNNKKIKTKYLSFNLTLVNQELLQQKDYNYFEINYKRIKDIKYITINYIQICKYLIIILLKIMSKLYEKN